MPVVSVALPGPWWTALSYNCDTLLQEGVRVRVPLGKSSRVGIVVNGKSSDAPAEIKDIIEIIDKSPALAPDLWKTIKYFGENWFVGTGTAAKCLLPAAFFDGETLEPCETAVVSQKSTVKYFYEPRDEKRYEQYLSAADDFSGTLFLLAEVAAAKQFWNIISPKMREEGLLFPATNSKKQWKEWKNAREGKYKFIVGSPVAAFVPLKNLRRIVVDSEQSGAWLTQKYPIYHLRSLLAIRANFAAAELWLGGNMPSAKAAMRCTQKSETAQNRVVFVDMHDVSAFDVRGLKEGVPISKPLLRETIRARQDGKFALWLLDRKGFAGEIYCDECGEALHCKKCGHIMRMEAKSGLLVCLNCASKEFLPECCPVCGGRFLEGVRPGLEALKEKAEPMLKYCCDTEVLLYDDKLPAASAILKEYPHGAVILGTRKILALMSELDCKVAGWIDADGEARGNEHNAHERAFALIWETIWRGTNPDERTVVVQSRRPGRDWQEGLKRGWNIFWQKELATRRDFELPPFIPLIKIEMPKNRGKGFAERLERNSIEYIEGDSSDDFFVRTKRFALLRKILESYYNIGNTKTGVPKVELKLN